MYEDVDERITMGVGNIARYPADAVVNPADSCLTGRDGVSGAIHRAAGPELLKACEKAAPCAEGEARLTPGFRLQAEHVIHMVVPKASRSPDDYRRVHRAYRAVLRLCHQHGIARLNIPPIPMKEAGLPPLEAASIALETVREWMAARQVPRQVNFCCFSAAELAHYEQALEALRAEELEATQD